MPGRVTPTTLVEAFRALDEMLSESDQQIILNAENIDDLIADLHHSLGRHLRNQWGLWAGSPLAKCLRETHGVTHPDDMSSFILREYIRENVPTVWERLLSS